MTEQGKQARKEYMREYMKAYRKKNKTKMAEIQERYWEKKAQEEEIKFICELSQDSKLMHELKSEKLAERLKTDETGAFYVSDLEIEILKTIQE